MKVYTDGACKNNPGRGGWAFAIITNDDKVVHHASAGVMNTTNNRMELTAVLEAFKWMDSHQECLNETIVVYTDSKYVRDGITSWIVKWKKNGWMTSKKTPVLNEDLWRDLDDKTEIYKDRLEWQWIKAHAGNKFNEIVDSLASAAATNAH